VPKSALPSIVCKSSETNLPRIVLFVWQQVGAEFQEYFIN